MQSSDDQMSYTSPRNTRSQQLRLAAPLLDGYGLGSPRDAPIVEMNWDINHTPQNRKPNNTMLSLSKSTRSKTKHIPWNDEDNPFARFHDVSYHQRQKLFPTPSPKMSNKSSSPSPRIIQNFSSPKIKDKSPSPSPSSRILLKPKLRKRSNKPLYIDDEQVDQDSNSYNQSENEESENFNEYYKNMLVRINTEEQVELPMPFLLRPNNEGNLTKLMCFTPNSKNGKHIVYDEIANTCRPIFKCQGCDKSFEIASALGGHLSKCSKLKKHNLNRLEDIPEEIDVDDYRSNEQAIVVSDDEELEQEILSESSEQPKRSKKIKKPNQISRRKADMTLKVNRKIKRSQKNKVSASPKRSSPRRQKQIDIPLRRSLARSAKSKARNFNSQQ